MAPSAKQVSSTTEAIYLPKETTADPVAQSIDCKIVKIAGRILVDADVGEYIVRTHFSVNKMGCKDYSWIPMEGMDCFTKVKLIGLLDENKLLVEAIYSGKVSIETPCFGNDGRWITVKEFKAHMQKTGEVLPPLVANVNAHLDLW